MLHRCPPHLQNPSSLCPMSEGMAGRRLCLPGIHAGTCWLHPAFLLGVLLPSAPLSWQPRRLSWGWLGEEREEGQKTSLGFLLLPGGPPRGWPASPAHACLRPTTHPGPVRRMTTVHSPSPEVLIDPCTSAQEPPGRGGRASLQSQESTPLYVGIQGGRVPMQTLGTNKRPAASGAFPSCAQAPGLSPPPEEGSGPMS